MNTLLIAIVIFIVACGALWHNKSPRSDDSAPSRHPGADNESAGATTQAESNRPQAVTGAREGNAGLRS